MDPNPDMTGVLTGRGKSEHRHVGGCLMGTEAQIPGCGSKPRDALRTQSCQELQDRGGAHPILSFWMSEFWLQNHERRHFCYFKQQGLWYFVMATPGREITRMRGRGDMF